MSLIITRNFKRAKAQDAVARNAASDELNVGDKIWITQYGRNYPYTITKKWKDGWTFWYKAKNDKSGKEEIVAGAFANALDAAAKDAKFEKGDKVYVDWFNGDQDYATVVKYNPSNDTYDVRLESGEIAHPKAKLLISADSHATDACGTDAKFQKGDKVRVWQYPVYGKLGEVVEATNGSMEYTVNVEGKDYPRIDYRRIVKVTNAAGDAAEFHVGQRVRAKDPAYEYSEGKALGAGMFTVKEVNNNGDVKLDDYGDVWISPSALVEANDACEDSAAKFRIGQEVIVKTKYAEPYKARIVGLWDMSQNGPYNEQGYLIKNIKGGGVESMPEHALSLVTAKDSAELNNDADLRAALSKMADIAKRLTDAKVSFKSGWTPDGIGEIILEFPNIESARKYNYYKLFNAWEAARSQIVPRWALNIGGYRVPRIEGNRMTISILHFST